MKVIIIGAGNVGFNIARRLAKDDVDVSVIEPDEFKIRRLKETSDVFAVQGTGDDPKYLIEAGVRSTDIVLAVTDRDAINLIACYLAKILSPNCKTVARCRNQDYQHYDYIFNKNHLNIDNVTNPEIIAAELVLKLIAIPGANEISEFFGGRVKLIGFHIRQDSPILGKSLQSLFQTRKRGHFLIVAISRQDKVIIPRGKSDLRVGDTIYIMVLRDSVRQACEMLGYKTRPLSNVMVLGGGNYGRFIAKALEDKGIHVKIIDRSLKKCEELNRSLDKTIILHGDGTDQVLLQQENVQKMDIFVAVTDDGPLNMMACKIAKKLGVGRTLSLTFKNTHYSLSQELDIDICINPRSAVTNSILQFIHKGKVLSVQTLGNEKAELIEFSPQKSSRVINTLLKDVNLPKNTLVALVEHNGEYTIPAGHDIIRTGDKVILFCLETAMKEVTAMLKE